MIELDEPSHHTARHRLLSRSCMNFLTLALNQYQFIPWPGMILCDFLRSAPISVVLIVSLDGTRFGPQ